MLKGRVDGLEARMNTLKAQQFSTTKLSSLATFVIGGISYSGNAYNSSLHTVNRRGRPPVEDVYENVTFNYDV
ncbi:MAG: hypothetical protein VKK05_00085 [Synechococcus sp.]|nr:hypothetical protein [Synechococcus sp.]